MELFLSSFFKYTQRLGELPLLLPGQPGKYMHRAFQLHGFFKSFFALGGQCYADLVAALHVLGPVDQAVPFHSLEYAGYGVRLAQHHPSNFGGCYILAHGVHQEEYVRGCSRQFLWQQFPLPHLNQYVRNLRYLRDKGVILIRLDFLCQTSPPHALVFDVI